MYEGYEDWEAWDAEGVTVEVATGDKVVAPVTASPVLVSTPSAAAINVSPVTPSVLFPADIKRRLDMYIRRCAGEISGIGTYVMRGDDFVIDRLFLLKQEITGSTTDLENGAVAELIEYMVNNNIPTERVVWWH